MAAVLAVRLLVCLVPLAGLVMQARAPKFAPLSSRSFALAVERNPRLAQFLFLTVNPRLKLLLLPRPLLSLQLRRPLLRLGLWVRAIYSPRLGNRPPRKWLLLKLLLRRLRRPLLLKRPQSRPLPLHSRSPLPNSRETCFLGLALLLRLRRRLRRLRPSISPWVVSLPSRLLTAA